jgi:quinol monooxygenase YgiN
MIVATLRILPRPERRGDVLEILRSIPGPVLTQPGCGACRIYEELGPENAVVLVERWGSAAAFEAHVRSEAFRRVLGAVEHSGHEPEIHFDHVSASEGIELVAHVRALAGTTGREARPVAVDAGPTRGNGTKGETQT